MRTTIKLILVIFALFILSTAVFAEEDFTEAKKLVDSKIGCDQLTNDQLEIIGDYYMELLHPGDAHIAMEEMMGGEGSESVRNVHINIARSAYCIEKGSNGGYVMMGRNYGTNAMMGGYNNVGYTNNNGGYTMMGNGFGTGFYGMGGFYGGLFMTLSVILFILLIVLICVLIAKTMNKR